MKKEYKAGIKPLPGTQGHLRKPTSVRHPEKDDNVCRPLVKKVCKTCKKQKVLSDYYFNRIKETYFSECKLCNKTRSSKWNKKNVSKYRANCLRHRKNNPDLYMQYKKKEYAKNKASYVKYGKFYRRSKHGKKTRLALNRIRELKKKFATPNWLTKNQKLELKQMYLNCPDGYHVDHVVPLSGKNVCGLHVPWNLQYLEASENIRKRNKLLS